MQPFENISLFGVTILKTASIHTKFQPLITTQKIQPTPI